METFDSKNLQNLDKQTLITMLELSLASNNALKKNVEDLNKRIDLLTEQMILANSQRFGRKSEKDLTDEADGQMRFVFNEAEGTYDIVCNLKEPEASEVIHPKAYRRVKKKKGKREADLADIVTTVVEHTITEEKLEEAFPDGKWKRLPDEVYKRLEFHPATFEVIEHHVAVYAGKGEKTVIKADRPTDMFRNSIATPSLVAGILNYKYVNAMPISRLAAEFERQDVKISSQNMCHWAIKSSDMYLSRLYKRMHMYMSDYHVIHADETPLKVNRDGRPTGSKSYMWVYRTGGLEEHPIVLYEYQKTRKTDHPREFLRDFRGYCVTDGYQVYHTIDNERPDLKVAGCWVHARRGFAELIKATGKTASKGTTAYKAAALIDEMFSKEKTYKGLSSGERLNKRQEEVAPLVDAFFAYIKKEAQNVAPKSKLGKSITYCLNQEKYLRVFLEDGLVPMDNNAAERSIRPFCLGKKNWNVIDTVSGARASAVLYSIAETAKANNLKPYEYFRYLLEEIPKHGEFEEDNYLDSLLPWSPDLPEECRKQTDE